MPLRELESSVASGRQTYHVSAATLGLIPNQLCKMLDRSRQIAGSNVGRLRVTGEVDSKEVIAGKEWNHVCKFKMAREESVQKDDGLFASRVKGEGEQAVPDRHGQMGGEGIA